MTLDDVLTKIRAAVAEAGSMAAWARKVGCTKAHVSAALKKRQAPSERVLDALGLEKVSVTTVSYRRKKR